MQEIKSKTGVAFLCDPHGVVRQILRDDLGVSSSISPGDKLASLFDASSAGMFEAFLADIRLRNAAIEWDLRIRGGQNAATLRFNGGRAGDEILVIGGSFSPEAAGHFSATQSFRDPLTGLYNQRYFYEMLDHELKQAGRNHQPVSVMIFDLDHFPEINDNLGQQAGEDILRGIGDLLRQSIRKEDIACRSGEYEFTVMFIQARLDSALGRAKEISRKVAGMHIPAQTGQNEPFTLSAGLATYPDHGTNGDVLMRRAGEALAQARASGPGRIVFVQ